MATPRVFISSTCYDLKYIRENLKFFIQNAGYEPVLSEEGNVFTIRGLTLKTLALQKFPIAKSLC
jgi:hypothetical protein